MRIGAGDGNRTFHPVLRKVLEFIGIRDVDVVRAGGSLAVNLGTVRLEDHLAKYEVEIADAARV